MADSATERVDDTLRIRDGTSGDTHGDGATPIQAKDNSSSISNGDKDNDTAEVKEASRKALTKYDDKAIKLWKKVLAAKADLNKLPEGHKDTSEKLSRLSDCKLNYHIALNTSTEGPYLEALSDATKARENPGADEFDRSQAMYMQMVCCYSLYCATDQVAWLHKCVTFGKECVDCMDGDNHPYECKAYSARCEHLAGYLQKLYEVEGCDEQITSASEMIGKAVDNTHPKEYRDDDDDDEPGNMLLYTRYRKWAELFVRQTDHRGRERRILMLQALMDQVTERIPHSLDDRFGHNYWMFRLGFHCRLWAVSKDPEHLQLLRQRTRELMEWENNNPICDCHANKDDPSMSSDPNDSLQVMRRAAGFFDRWNRLDEWDGMWSEHIASIDTSIALWEEVSKSIPRLTCNDIKLDMEPKAQLELQYFRRYKVTGTPCDG